MSLPGIDSELLSAELDDRRRARATSFGVLLVDGSIVYARTASAKLSAMNSLALSYSVPGGFGEVEIPLCEIAGILPLRLPVSLRRDEVDEADSSSWASHSIEEMLGANVLAQAEARDLLKSRAYVSYIMRAPREDAPTKLVRFARSEVVYCDTNYLLQSGGLTGANAQGGPAGVGVQWAPNVRKTALRRIKGNLRPITDLCGAGKTARLSGYVEFLDLSGLSETQQSEYRLRNDDGLPFVPAYVRKARSSPDQDAALVYFRDLWGPVPADLEVWERYIQPLRLFGTVVHATPPREAFKHFGCYMLVRAAGVIV